MRQITFLIALAAAVSANAAELRVPEQYRNIQAAIVAAANGDVIVVGPGTYREAIDVSGKEITLRSAAGAAETILDGNGGATSIVTARNTDFRKVVVQGFTLRNGYGALPRACGVEVLKGGAILSVGTRLSIVDCVFEDNGSADVRYGGAVFACETHLHVEGSRFERNRAVHGGAITIASAGPRESSINGSSFTANTGETDSGAILVKLRSSAMLSVRDSDFTDNDAGFGAGMEIELLERSRMIVERVQFSGNRAGGTGGGVDILVNDTASIAISGCRFDANRAAEGGGMELVADSESTASIASCTFSGGIASFGGGVNTASLRSSVVEIANCDFTGNQASFGGGLEAEALDGTIRISGSRFLDNVAQPRPETGIYRDLCFVDGLPPEGNGQYFGGGADLRTQHGGAITVSSSLFTGNSGLLGSGLLASSCAGGEINVVNDTIVANTGSGVHLRSGLSREPEYTAFGAIRIANSIIRDNTGTEIVTERYDTRVDAEVRYSNVEGGAPGTGNFDVPPSFVDAAARDYRLAPGSACIDAGDALTPVVDDTDLARHPRRSGGRVDVGAYEYQWSSPRRRSARF